MLNRKVRQKNELIGSVKILKNVHETRALNQKPPQRGIGYELNLALFFFWGTL